ncbi:hypothetical protein DV713_01640 [Parageobacillus thermoglucosidasius]|uniref:hypothetical protein n=1 Tax=Parageobacillus thermoglucosidasius TaxID=1426 RepID=UPI000E1226E5|nr:hypothetical protein [Parageobacillus thermoglucosidasius]RDE36311.1 hypothetical protein DV713_01640 [Parageobacillus thermoglucosidasius]
MGVMARHRHSANLRLCGGVWIQERRGGDRYDSRGKSSKICACRLNEKNMMPVKKGIDENNHWVGLRSIAGGSDEDVIKKLPER